MSDTQILTMALAVIVPLSLLLYSNSRITDTKETLRAEIRASHAELLAELRDLKSMVKELDSKLETKFAMHELEHHRK